MKKLKIGILGATGLVGQAMLECIEQLDLPFEELRLFASEHSAGKQVRFLQKDYLIELLTKDRLKGLDVLFGAVSADVSKQLAPMIKEANVLYIDNSSAFRMNPDVPLVIPEINLQAAINHQGMIANPNCSTIITLMAVEPIHELFGLKKMIVSTYQAVSGAGKQGMEELHQQLLAYPDSSHYPKVFQETILNNCIPSIGQICENGFSTEELKMVNESRKILNIPSLDVLCTCVRIPVLRAHSMSIYCETEKEVDLPSLMNRYQQKRGVYVSCKLPTPLRASSHFDVQIGRIRKDPSSSHGLLLWCCGDQIYKGAALNAVQIAQSLLVDPNPVI